MSKHSTIILLSLVVAVLPFIGVPTSWKTPLYLVCGLIIAALAFVLRQELRNREAHMRERGSPDAHL